MSTTCFKITPFGYDRRPSKTQALQGWHDIHRAMFANPQAMGAKRIRRETLRLLYDYPAMRDQVQSCTSSNPCGLGICVYCAMSVAIRNATLLDSQFPDPIGFTLTLEPLSEEQFARQITVGKVTKGGRTLDNPADHRWANKNFATRIRKHTGDAKLVMMPDVDWCPKSRLVTPHYHCVIDASDRATLKLLRKKYPGQIVWSRDVDNMLRYINYGQKVPLLRWKHLRQVYHVEQETGKSLKPMIDGVNRLFLLWKALRPQMLLLGFKDREFVGKLRSQDFALTPAFSWRACKDPS